MSDASPPLVGQSSPEISLADLIAAGNALEGLVRMASLDPRRRVIVERWVAARRGAAKWDAAMQRTYGEPVMFR